MSAAALFLGERITVTDAAAALLIVGGVALGSLRRRTAVASHAGGVPDLAGRR